MKKETWDEIRNELFDFTSGKWLDTNDIIVSHAKLCEVVKEMCDKSYDLGKQNEKSEIAEAIKKLSIISGQAHRTQDMAKSATMMLEAYQDQHARNYIHHLEERIRELTKEKN